MRGEEYTGSAIPRRLTGGGSEPRDPPVPDACC
jgi:hypothetical protein